MPTRQKGCPVTHVEQSPPELPEEHAARHDPIYDRLAESADFVALRRLYRSFVFPATVAFLAWYLLYVVMSNWAPGFMSKRLFDTHVNVALVFGLLQFATTFLLAWLYSQYSTKRLDPLARRLDEQYVAELGRRTGRRA
jgi:uncharacterized membrane protein (DUF485 family)